MPKVIRTVTAHPGDKLIIPENVRIISVAKDDGVDATSDCIKFQDAIDAADTFSCFVIIWQVDTDGGTASPWYVSGPTDLTIAEMNVGGVALNLNAMRGDGNFSSGSGEDDDEYGGDSQLFTALQADRTLPIKVVSHSNPNSEGQRASIHLAFKAPSLVGPTAYLKFSGTGSTTPTSRVYAELCADCCPAT